MFDIVCETKCPTEYVELSSISVRGDLGPMTVWHTEIGIGGSYMRKEQTEELWTKIKDTMNRKSSSSSETQIDNWIVYIKSVHAKTQIVDVNKPNSRPNSQETGENQKTPEQIAAEKEAAD